MKLQPAIAVLGYMASILYVGGKARSEGFRGILAPCPHFERCTPLAP
jgi:hypothetical protein